MTPLQPDNPCAQEQLQQWLKQADVAELSEQEQEAIGQLLAEFQKLPSAVVSPQLEGRLQSLSHLQRSPINPLKCFLGLLAAGLAATGAVLTWQFNGLELKVAQKEPTLVAELPKAHNTSEPERAAAVPTSKEFLLTSSQLPGVQAKVTIQPEKATNLLIAQGLPPLSAVQTYRLWAETPLGLQGCMSFRPDAEGNARIQVPSEPSGSAISLLISIDPIYEGSSAEKPAKPVLTSI